MPQRRVSRDRRRHQSSPSESPSLTPEAHTDYGHEEFVDKVQATRNSLRWSSRRASLQKKKLDAKTNGGSSHKSAARINEETENEEQLLRERKRREEEYERRKQERLDRERAKRARERYNREHTISRERRDQEFYNESTYSGRSEYEIKNDINNFDFKLIRQHSEPDFADLLNRQQQGGGHSGHPTTAPYRSHNGGYPNNYQGAIRAFDEEEKGMCQGCIIS